MNELKQLQKVCVQLTPQNRHHVLGIVEAMVYAQSSSPYSFKPQIILKDKGADNVRK